MVGNVIDVLAINETRLSNEISSDRVKLPGYDFISKDRNRNGDVGIYVRNTLSANERGDLNIDTIEAICIEVKKPKAKPFAIYRPPGSHDILFQKIQRAIIKLDSQDKEIILVGDFNCNLLSKKTDTQTEYLKSVTEVYQIKQLITEPTRLMTGYEGASGRTCSLSGKLIHQL